MVKIDTSFLSDFTVSAIDERPAVDASLKYFFRPKSRARDGLLFKVKPIDQPAWRGMCAFGDFQFCGLFTHPHKEKLFVVSCGACYLANAMHPEEYSIWPTTSALGAFSCPDLRLLIVYDCRTVFALNESGVAWEAKLQGDGMSGVRLEGDTIVGNVDLPGHRDATHFRIHAFSGSVLTN